MDTSVKNTLFSIGKLSKITGVHVQSLRYYERLGILSPVYIDPDTKYRYYSFPQIKVVEAIGYCVELDIPLKDFTLFLSADRSQIDYERLLHYGKTIAQCKIADIQEKMRFFEEIDRDMLHGEQCVQTPRLHSHFPTKTYLTVPYSGTQSTPAFQAALCDLLVQIRKKGWQTNYDSGLLAIYRDNTMTQFAYADILHMDDTNGPNIFHIPEADFVCIQQQESDITRAPEIFPEQFQKGGDKLILERQLFTAKFQYAAPIYELRCAAI